MTFYLFIDRAKSLRLPRFILSAKGRWTHGISLCRSGSSFIFLIMLGGRQYIQAASHPEGANQAVRGLRAMTNENGRPIKFIYVKDMAPSSEKPLDPSRFSDMNRRGASPDPRKGNRPDPSSMGQSPLRQTGRAQATLRSQGPP